MPIMVQHDTLATDVKVGDTLWGSIVKKIDRKQVNIDFTLDDGMGGKTRRIRKDEPVILHRPTATVAEYRASLEEKVARNVEQFIAQVNRTVETGDASIRAKIDKSTDLLNTFEWDTSGWLEELHTLRLMRELQLWLTKRDDMTVAEIVVAFRENVKKQMLEWYPHRSTSPMHNLSEEQKHEAMRQLISRWDYAMSSVVFYSDKLNEFNVVWNDPVFDDLAYEPPKGE